MRKTAILTGLVGLLAVTTTAKAAEEDLYEWAAPPTNAQLYADDKPVPAGMGSVFIPSLTNPKDEPRVIIVGSDEVITAATGRRVVLAPGAYVLLVGSDRPELAQGVEFIVQAGRTTVVPPRWGGLRVEVVNRRLKPKKADYDLIHVDTGKVIELPDDLKQEREDAPRTFLLAPGLYRLNERGMDTEKVTSPNFATVHVPEGGLAHFRLFVDGSGTVVGGGIVPIDKVQDRVAERSNWDPSLIVGIEGSAFQYQAQPGFPDLTVVDASGFAEFDIDYADKRQLIDLGAEAQYGTMFVQPGSGKALPWIKSRDNLEGNATYTFLLNEGLGIYARGKARTQMTETRGIAAENQELKLRNLNGSITTQRVEAPGEYLVSDAFNPLWLTAGGGARLRVLAFRDLDLSLRGGVGYRNFTFGGGFVSNDNPNTNAIELTQIADFDEIGIEAGASALIRINGFMTLESDLDLFQALDTEYGIMGEWDNDLNMRITRAVSINYKLTATRMDWITERIMVRQGGSIRVAFSLL